MAFAVMPLNKRQFTGTGTSATTASLQPPVPGKIPAVRYARLTADVNTTLDFYSGSTLMHSFTPNQKGEVVVKNFGPGVFAQADLGSPFVDNIAFGFKVNCNAGATPWDLHIEDGFAG